MRRMNPPWLVVARLAFAAALGGCPAASHDRVDGGAPPAAVRDAAVNHVQLDAGRAATGGPTSQVDNKAGTSSLAPTSEIDAGTPEPVAPVDCLHGDVGPSSPESFVEMDYQRVVCSSPGSECTDFVSFTAGCALTLQTANVRHDAVADAADCAALSRWATSAVLWSALNDARTCLPELETLESTEIQLKAGPGPRKKTALCQLEPYLSQRACIASIRSKYFGSL